MRVLENLQPQRVFSYFEDLCGIPHGSGNTKAISDYFVRFAKNRGLKYVQDEQNNVVIYKAGTKGYENAPTVIVQGHMDMVAVKDPDCPIDLQKDGLQLQVTGDYISAKGTSLGGDDGVAVAMGLALLESTDIPHPPLEVVLTVDEETGMDGATALDPALLAGRRMLNIDSEEEGVFTVSCAGGMRANCSIPVAWESCALHGLRITVDGLIGGHSGVEIHKERGNANILMGRVLQQVQKVSAMRLVSVQGGLMDNAITLSATAEIGVLEKDIPAAKQAVAEILAQLKNEFAVSDPGISVRAEDCGAISEAMTEESTGRVIDFLTLVPNGVYAMSMDISGLVQTSCNLGILKTNREELRASSSIRSALTSQKQMLYCRFEALCKRLGGSVRPTGDYPGWQYRRESVLRDTMVEVYTRLYGAEPKVEAIHAGLECGLFADKLPGLDAVSFGPNQLDIHTTRERLSVSSVARTWQYLQEVLKQLKN